HERLYANEACFGIAPGFIVQMFAATKPDLKPNIFNRYREKRAQVRRRRLLEVELQLGQQARDGAGLYRANGLAVSAAIKGLRAACATLFGHGPRLRDGQVAATASFSDFTRSVFSQEKEPSRPGLRPKWP